MTSKDMVSSLICTVVGLFYLGYSLQYDYYYYVSGTVKPGPGQFPRIIALLIIAFSLFIFFSSWVRKKKEHGETVGEAWGKLEVTKRNLNCAVSTLLLIGLYIIVIDWLGFLTCSIALLILLSRLMGEKRWGANIVLGVASGLVAYVIFWVVMRIPLPMGHLFAR